MTAQLFAAVIAVLLTCYCLMRLRLWLASKWFLVQLWRWHTGQPHHGKPVTDRGWRRHGQKALTPTGHATRWQHLPRWKQTAHRTGASLAGIGLIYGILAYPAQTAAVVAVALLALLAFAGWAAVRWLRIRRDHKTWLYPLHLAAHERAGIPRAERAGSWIKAELDESGAVRRAELKLPPGWPADDKDKGWLVATAAAKLGIEAPEPAWRNAGPAPLLTLTHSPPPPGHVKMADLLADVRSCRPDELIIGVGKNDTLIKASLATDSPHIAISMGTGAGKSNLAGWLMLQMLLRGSIGLVLDAKRRLSYPWILKDEHTNIAPLPNVAYAWTTAQLHECMEWMSGELDRRGDVAFAGMDARGKVHGSVGPRLFTLAEELNLAVPRLRSYWSAHRPDGAPAKSPAFTGLGDVAFAGRQVSKHLVLIGQMITAEATGSRDSSVKEQCGVKLMARYGPKGWRIMAEDIPMPPPPTALGRVQVVTAGKAHEAQTPEMDGVEARELVLASDMALLPYGMPCAPEPVTVSPSLLLAGGPDLRSVTVSVTPPPGPVTLSEAIGQGLLHPDTTLAALRMGRHRDTDFPCEVGYRSTAKLYDPQALATWDAGRRS